MNRSSTIAAGLALGLIALITTKAEAKDVQIADADADEPLGASPPEGEKTQPTHAILGKQGTLFTGAAVSTTPAALLGYFPVNHLATTIGLGFTYDANGSPTSPLTDVKGAPNNRIGSDLFLDVMYFVHDVAPFAMGPELNVITSLSPNVPATAVVVTPLLALRYAPWKVPIAIGTGLGMSFTYVKGLQPVASLATQGLDLVYSF
jgi:hypothetical protein